MGESVTLFEYIPTEISNIIISLVGDVEYIIIAHVCQTWRIIIQKSFYNYFTIILFQKKRFIKNVARNGYLGIVKWARENGCQWKSSICSEAAQGGHLEVLIWARQNGCSWDSLTRSKAAQGGHLEVLKWARENYCLWNDSTCSKAARGGHLEVLNQKF